MKKVRAQSAFIKEFEGIYELQQEELILMKEECLAERFAISKAKDKGASNEGGAPMTHKVYEENEFAVSH